MLPVIDVFFFEQDDRVRGTRVAEEVAKKRPHGVSTNGGRREKRTGAPRVGSGGAIEQIGKRSVRRRSGERPGWWTDGKVPTFRKF
jgi:hypothetical protein